jgi:hypothetical protein
VWGTKAQFRPLTKTVEARSPLIWVLLGAGRWHRESARRTW